MSKLLNKFNGLRWWLKLVIVIIAIVVIIFWSFILSDSAQWWHWGEWVEHIRNNH